MGNSNEKLFWSFLSDENGGTLDCDRFYRIFNTIAASGNNIYIKPNSPDYWLLIALADKVIQYSDEFGIYQDDSRMQDPLYRVQLILNSVGRFEGYIAQHFTDECRASSSKWSLRSTYDFGSDFYIQGFGVECKVYGSVDTLNKARTRGSFHNADIACCYVINDHNHWHWLYKENNIYVEKSEVPKFFRHVKLGSITLCKVVPTELNNGMIIKPWIN